MQILNKSNFSTIYIHFFFCFGELAFITKEVIKIHASQGYKASSNVLNMAVSSSLVY